MHECMNACVHEWTRAPAAREGDAGEEPDGKDVGEPRLEGDVFVLLQRDEPPARARRFAPRVFAQLSST